MNRLQFEKLTIGDKVSREYKDKDNIQIEIITLTEIDLNKGLLHGLDSEGRKRVWDFIWCKVVQKIKEK